MQLGLELKIAYRFFRSKAKDKFVSAISIFSIAGIALGVATLIVVMAVMKGYEVELISRLNAMNGDVVVVPAKDADLSLLQKQLSDIPHVTSVISQVNGQGMLSANNTSAGVMVRGTDKNDLGEKKIVANSIQEGSLKDYDENSIIIGNALAKQLGVTVGDQVRFISPQSNSTVLGFVPKFKTLTVAAIFDVGMYEHNLGTVFIPLDLAFKLFDKNSVDYLEVAVDSPINTISVIENIGKASFAEGLIKEVRTAYDSNMALKEALQVERVVMYFILTLIILVAAFNIISSLVILVKDKSKNIAILKTFGMSSFAVMRIFVWSGMFIGMIGTAIGGIVGVLFASNIENIKQLLESFFGTTMFNPVVYYLTKLPCVLDVYNVIIVIITALVLSNLSTLYPAFRAASLEPAKSLRNE